jgi:hypothetical protein
MGYSNLKTISKEYKLSVVMTRLFDNVKVVAPSVWLTESIVMSELMPLTNEKTKSERIISPILLEAVKTNADKITLFSGEDIEANANTNLAGPCDFFFALHPPKPFIDAPIIALIKANDEDMEYGLGQCVSQMYGVKLYNKAEGKDTPVIYGCATDGGEWQFLKLADTVLHIDKKKYTDVKEILGVWHTIFQLCLAVKK